MPTLSGITPPPPKDWQEFQRICRDLWSQIWDDSNAQENGRQGQPQAGVDVFGQSRKTKGYIGVQCKQKDGLADSELTVVELRKEVGKAKSFKPHLSEFIMATTGLRDGKVQEAARVITEAHSVKGLFSVHVWSWEDIGTELTNYPQLLQKHYPDLYGSTMASSKIPREVMAEVTDQVRRSEIGLKQEISSMYFEGLKDIKQDIKIIAGSELEAELTHIRKLIEANKPKICLEFIEDLMKKKWDMISDKTKFNLLADKGFCFLGQSKIKEAGSFFVQALQFNKEDEKGLVDAALGYFMLGENDAAQRCIEGVLHKNPLNQDAWTLKIQYAASLSDLDKLVETIPKSLLDTSAINWARAVALQRGNSLREAERYMELALTNNKERRIDLLVQLGALTLKNTMDDARQVGSNTLIPEVRSRIEASVSLFSEALSRLSESEVVPIRTRALIDRGIGYRILGQNDNAKRDLDQAIEWESGDFEAAKQRAILSNDEDKYDESIRLLKPFAEAENTNVAKILLADTYRQAKNRQEAIKILQDCEKWAGDDGIKMNGLMIQAECYLELLDKPSALGVVDKMKKMMPLSFVPFLFQARVERTFGQLEVAQQAAVTAQSLVGKDIDFFNEWKLADELYALKLYAEAAQIYARIAIPERNDGITGRLIESYYEADQWDLALDYCKRLRAHHPEVQYATEIAASILESTGDLVAAIEILQEYLSLRMDDDHARLRLASIFLRDGNKHALNDELAKIKQPEKLRSKDILHYASLLSAKGDSETAIKILYEARRKHSNDPEIDMGYVGIILGRGERIGILEDPTAVVVDTVVLLENSSKENYFYIIEDRVDADSSKREVNLESPIAKELLGKKVGDRVDLEKNLIQPSLWTITSLKSKFAHALVETMDTHSKRFPGRRDFFRISTPTDEKGDVDGVQLRKQMLSALPDDSQQETLENYYKQGKLTIGSLAKLYGKDVFATTLYLASQKEVGIYSSTGSQEEYVKGIKDLSICRGVVVEPTSIIIMELLGVKDWLNERYGPFVIAQSTLDELNIMLAEGSIGGKQPSFTIFREGGEIYKHETSAEDKQKRLDALATLIQWLRKNCCLKPVNLTLSLKRTERGELEEIFDKAMFDSMLLAKEYQMVLYTEDGRFRGLAEVEYGVQGIWTHCLLRDALIKGIINDEQFVDHTISLLSLNVHHVSMNAATLVAAAQKASWKPDYPITSALFNLSGLRCGEDAAVVVAGEFIYALWTEVLPPLVRDMMVFATLDAVAIYRRRDIVAMKISQFISHKFHLWPNAANALQGLVNSWKMSRLS